MPTDLPCRELRAATPAARHPRPTGSSNEVNSGVPTPHLNTHALRARGALARRKSGAIRTGRVPGRPYSLRGPRRGNGFSSTPWMTLKIVVVAPTPRASVVTARPVEAGCFRSRRNPYRMSRHRASAANAHYATRADLFLSLFEAGGSAHAFRPRSWFPCRTRFRGTG